VYDLLVNRDAYAGRKSVIIQERGYRTLAYNEHVPPCRLIGWYTPALPSHPPALWTAAKFSRQASFFNITLFFNVIIICLSSFDQHGGRFLDIRASVNRTTFPLLS
jgi:hypothetical protein